MLKQKKRLFQMLSRILILAAILLPNSDSPGQEDREQIKNSFTAIALTDLPYENLYYRFKQKAEPIEFRNNRRSLAHPLSPSDFFEVYTDSKDPKIKYQLIGKTRTISSSKALYFFRKNRSTEPDALPLELYGIDDSNTRFPKSSFRFFNFMDLPLSIHFNGARFTAKPNSETVKKLELSANGAFTPFVVKEMNGKILGGTRLFSSSTNREMVLIFPPKKGKKRLDIRYFSD